jgi:ketosteroid isomerase-like protein
MSSDNVQLIREASVALEERGVDGILPYMHPDFEVTTPPELASEPDTYRGEAGIRRYFDSFYEAMEEVHFVPDEFVDAGEHVIVPTRLVATGRTTGIEVEQAVVLVWSFREGKIVRVEPVATLEEARERCGLQSQPTS